MIGIILNALGDTLRQRRREYETSRRHVKPGDPDSSG